MTEEQATIKALRQYRDRHYDLRTRAARAERALLTLYYDPNDPITRAVAGEVVNEIEARGMVALATSQDLDLVEVARSLIGRWPGGVPALRDVVELCKAFARYFRASGGFSRAHVDDCTRAVLAGRVLQDTRTDD